jgi:acyl dehydratase
LAAAEPPAAGLARLATNIVKLDGSFGCQGSALLQLPGGRAPASTTAAPAVSEVESWNGLNVGQQATLERTYSRADLAEYLDLLAETNPLYTDPNAAPLPGPLLGALFSCILGTRLPGRGTNWLKQRFVFHAPAYPDQTLTGRVQVVRLRPEKALVNLRTWITTADGQLVCDGEALVGVGDLEM